MFESLKKALIEALQREKDQIAEGVDHDSYLRSVGTIKGLTRAMFFVKEAESKARQFEAEDDGI